MRVDCKYYESRTYASGETVRMCRLGLAPDAPFSCPDDCKGYARRMIDVGWSHGSLQATAGADDPPKVDDDAAAVLAEAAEILNTIGADVIADVQRKKSGKKRRWKRR